MGDGLAKQQKEFESFKERIKLTEISLDATMIKVRFQDEQRTAILDKMQEQVIPVKDILYNYTTMRKEHSEAINRLEFNLNKSIQQLKSELENMKDPLFDML